MSTLDPIAPAWAAARVALSAGRLDEAAGLLHGCVIWDDELDEDLIPHFGFMGVTVYSIDWMAEGFLFVDVDGVVGHPRTVELIDTSGMVALMQTLAGLQRPSIYRVDTGAAVAAGLDDLLFQETAGQVDLP